MSLRKMIAVVTLFCAAFAAHADGLAWRVDGPAGPALFLVGTIHAADERFYPLPAPIEKAFAASEVLVVEVDMSAADPQDAQRVAAERGILPRGESLSALLGPELWDAVAAWGAGVGADPRALERMRPWLAGITLVSFEMQRAGLRAELGMERHFGARARERSLPIVELETVEGQLGTLAALPDAVQVAFVRDAVADLDGFAAAVERIVGAWRRGDADEMTRVLDDSFTDPLLYEPLMRARNRAWLPELERMAADGRVHFVAVGALHLVGEDGLVKMLERRGYRVERL